MQQINLYHLEFRPSRVILRSQHMLWLSLVFLGILLTYSFFTQYQLSVVEQQVLGEQRAQAELKVQLQRLSDHKPPLEASQQLEGQIVQLQKRLQHHQQILNMIAHQDLGNDLGFSAQVNALGQAALDTIALESFSLWRAGKYAELSGQTRSADQVPLYLQRLREDPSFSQVGFGVLKLAPDPQASGLLKFSLAQAAVAGAGSVGAPH
jgi:hypothetical protein